MVSDRKIHPDVPNLLRVFLGETSKDQGGHDALLIECNIDDMNPEFFEYISERLFKAGASDVFFTNIIMKKGRPGIVLECYLRNRSRRFCKKYNFY